MRPGSLTSKYDGRGPMIDPGDTHAADGDRYEWRGGFRNDELETLHAEAFGHAPTDADWADRLHRHSLGWVCARREDRLIGFANVAWDGASHAFLLDIMVALTDRHRGVGTTLISMARLRAAAAGCEWLHVDFENQLQRLYIDACGFRPTAAGIIRLREP